ncbi:MAG: MBL fold metallo-hydrolase [Candidatus Omnitrophica bacterium]|nr:MBL fold metallo-hydrolase [Candidatus Omnitrophota bacterium]
MKIQVIFDGSASKTDLLIGWGFSCLIDGRILFDTGENGEWLIHNMQQTGIDINEIQSVVISHDHWDHTGGLWKILQLRKNLAVYACPGFTRSFKKKVRQFGGQIFENDHLTEISKDVFVTDEIRATYKQEPMPEQSIILKSKNGISIITGCAHPGIIEIIERAKKNFPEEKIYLVMGGFHLIETDTRIIETIAKQLKNLQIAKIGPCHCSGKKAEDIFRKTFKKNFVSISAGSTILV